MVLVNREMDALCNKLLFFFQEGSMRCDVNVSVRKRGEQEFGTKVEVKNMNSFNAMQRAIEYEFTRQARILLSGNKSEIVQETRLWDENKQITAPMRRKEGLADYRYFPEPDLKEVILTELFLEDLAKSLPELPSQRRKRYTSLGLSEYDSLVLSDDEGIASYFDGVLQSGAPAKQAANWVMGDVNALIKERGVKFSHLKMKPETLAEMINLIEDSVISGKIGKEILADLADGKAEEIGVRSFVESNGLVQISDESKLQEIVDKVLNANKAQLEAYRGGKTKLKGFFVGQVMKESNGKANPQIITKLLMDSLDSDS